ncbi:MAG: DedA family protein, partial [Pseudomonadota bacterium]
MTFGETFLNLFENLPDTLLYVCLGISAFMENILPPIPGDTITALGAFLVGVGRLNFLGVYVVTTIGSLLGFLALFWIGRYLGRRFFVDKDFRFFKKEDILRAEAWFGKYGYLLIALNRFLPGVRSVISLGAGVLQLNPYKVALL